MDTMPVNPLLAAEETYTAANIEVGRCKQRLTNAINALMSHGAIERAKDALYAALETQSEAMIAYFSARKAA